MADAHWRVSHPQLHSPGRFSQLPRARIMPHGTSVLVSQCVELPRRRDHPARELDDSFDRFSLLVGEGGSSSSNWVSANSAASGLFIRAGLVRPRPTAPAPCSSGSRIELRHGVPVVAAPRTTQPGNRQHEGNLVTWSRITYAPMPTSMDVHAEIAAAVDAYRADANIAHLLDRIERTALAADPATLAAASSRFAACPRSRVRRTSTSWPRRLTTLALS